MADADNNDRTTLIGVVSGGAGCGQGVPGWYSKVSFHIKWIKCIIDKSAQFNNNQEKVQQACKDTVKPEPTCVNQNELVVDLDVFENIENKKYGLCESIGDALDFDLRDDQREDKTGN